MRITEQIADSFHRLWSLLSKKEKVMSEQTVIAPTNTEAEHDLSPLESFANETATTSAVATPATGAPAAAPVQKQEDTAAQADSTGVAPIVAEQPAAADAPVDLDQQLATQDPLANGSASAGASSASTPGLRNDQQPDASVSPPAPASSASAATDTVRQDIAAGVKDFAQAFSFVEQGVLKLGSAAKDELIALAKKYM